VPTILLNSASFDLTQLTGSPYSAASVKSSTLREACSKPSLPSITLSKWRSKAERRRLVSKDTKPTLPEALPTLKQVEYVKDSDMIKSIR